MVELCNRRVFTFRFHLQGKSKQPSTKYDKSPKGVADCCVFVVAIQENMPTTRKIYGQTIPWPSPPHKKYQKSPKGGGRLLCFCCCDSRKYVSRQPTVRFQKRDQGSNHKNKLRRLGPSTNDLTESTQLKTVVSSRTQREKLDQRETRNRDTHTRAWWHSQERESPAY
jgi:hypothetical protein